MKKLGIISLKAISFFMVWSVLVGVVLVYLLPEPGADPPMWRLLAEAVPLAAIAALSLLFWLIEKRRIPLIGWKGAGRNVLIGLGAGASWLGLSVLLLMLSGALTIRGRNSVASLAVWLAACFLNVVMQELLVRGYLYQLIKKEYHVPAAVIVTTLLFTALHGGAFEAGAAAVLNVAAMSVFMCIVLEYTQSLIAPIIIHALWNGVGAVILGGVSLADDYPHLYNTVFSGNELLSGGSCKLEGSIAVLALSIAFSVLFYRLKKRSV